MPTRKQRRRQQKGRRHEYEYVYVDEEGREVDAPEVDDTSGNGKQSAQAKSSRARRTPATARSARSVQPPSWRRVLKRGLIFAPLMYITVTLLAGDELTLAGRVVQTLFLLMVFLPFSYLMDSLTYRMWRKRAGQADAGSGRSSGR